MAHKYSQSPKELRPCEQPSHRRSGPAARSFEGMLEPPTVGFAPHGPPEEGPQSLALAQSPQGELVIRTLTPLEELSIMRTNQTVADYFEEKLAALVAKQPGIPPQLRSAIKDQIIKEERSKPTGKGLPLLVMEAAGALARPGPLPLPKVERTKVKVEEIIEVTEDMLVFDENIGVE